MPAHALPWPLSAFRVQVTYVLTCRANVALRGVVLTLLSALPQSAAHMEQQSNASRDKELAECTFQPKLYHSFIKSFNVRAICADRSTVAPSHMP